MYLEQEIRSVSKIRRQYELFINIICFSLEFEIKLLLTKSSYLLSSYIYGSQSCLSFADQTKTSTWSSFEKQ